MNDIERASEIILEALCAAVKKDLDNLFKFIEVYADVVEGQHDMDSLEMVAQAMHKALEISDIIKELKRRGGNNG